MFEMRYLLDLMGILYLPETSLIVKLKYPRYWRAENLGKVGVLVVPESCNADMSITGASQVHADWQLPYQAIGTTSTGAESVYKAGIDDRRSLGAPTAFAVDTQDQETRRDRGSP